MSRITGVFVLLVCGLISAAGPARTQSVPDSHQVATPDLRIGAVFQANTVVHGCSGAVLDSPDGDLIITAAHCMIGPGVYTGFAPGYSKGAAPKGMWNVSQVYLDPRWVRNQDVDHDYAVLRVTPGFGAPNTSIEKAVGGGLRVSGSGPRPGETVTTTGYSAGLFDSPTTCTRPTGTENGYATFTCDGFGFGTSGGPWVAHGNDLVGIIGGPQQGGCSSGVSYTPPFDSSLTDLLRRAKEHGPADTAPIVNVVVDC